MTGAGRRAAGAAAVRRDWSARLEPIRALVAVRLVRLRQVGRRAAHAASVRAEWRRIGSIAALIVSGLVLWNLVWTSAAQQRPREPSHEGPAAETASSDRQDATANGSSETGITPEPPLENPIVAARPNPTANWPAPPVPERKFRAPVEPPRSEEISPAGRHVVARPRAETPGTRVVAAARPKAPAGTNPVGPGLKSALAWLQQSGLLRLVSSPARPASRRAEADRGSVSAPRPERTDSNAGRRPPTRPVAPEVGAPVVPASSDEPPPGVAEVKVAFTAGSERGEGRTRVNVLPPPPATVAFRRGMAAFGIGSFNRALADFTEAIRLDPNSSGARFYRGITHAIAGRSQEALADYTAAIQLQPNHPDAYLERAKVYIGLGADRLALGDYTEALRRRADADVYLARGRLHHEMGSYEQALADCDRALRLRPRDTKAIHLRGLIHYHAGDYAGAVADFTEALRLDPNDAAAHRARGDAHARLGKRAEAEADHAAFERLSRPAGDGVTGQPSVRVDEGGPGAGRGQSP